MKNEKFFIDHIKFHLDQVQFLGEFVEIEGIDKSHNPELKLQIDAHFSIKFHHTPIEDLV